MKTPTHLLLTPMALLLPQLAMATFTFNSNGTGADGDWILGETDCPVADTSVVLDVGESGIKQYSSINIHENCIVSFTPRGGGATNYSEPVRLIVSGDVVISGTLDLSGENGAAATTTTQTTGGRGGPGGFDGGSSGAPPSGSGYSGFGPGGGNGGIYSGPSHGSSGSLLPTSSDVRLQPLIGGSGGGGASKNTSSYTAGSGGGGGGALLIAASGAVTVTGTILTAGGSGGDVSRDGGDGAGGVTHLIANQISGDGTISGALAILETLDNQSTITGNQVNMIEFQQLDLDLSPDTQNLQITQLGGEAVTPGTPLVLDQDGEMTLELSSSGLDEGTTIRVAVSNSRSRTVSTADATLDADGNGSVTLTLESGVLMIIAYVVE